MISTQLVPDHTSTLADDLRVILRGIAIRATRFGIDCDYPGITPTKLRSLFGLALKQTSEATYRRVFEPPGSRPRPFVIRSRSDERPGFEFIAFADTINDAEIINAAWQRAADIGFTERRERFPFTITSAECLEADGQPCGHFLHNGIWSAHTANCGTMTPNASAAIYTLSPLRLLQSQMKQPRRRGDRPLLQNPTLNDVVTAGIRRISQLADVPRSHTESLVKAALAACPDSQFDRLTVQSLDRFSRNHNDRIRMDGVIGRLNLPAGTGPFFSLLHALQWLHVGKGTVHGLGRIELRSVEHLPGKPR